MEFFDLKIADIKQETADTKTFYFEIPDDIREKFMFLPGQYLTINAVINGDQVRRPYSISTVPGQNKIGVSVKLVNKGVMSHYLHHEVFTDMNLEVMPPTGHFTLRPDHDKSRIHYFIAAGSGITPIMSMIQTVLEEEPKSICHLLYGSRSESEIIFRAELDNLEKKYAGQLTVTHILSKPEKKASKGLAGWFGKKEAAWNGKSGRINASVIHNFLSENHPKYTDRQYYICGPGDMIEKTEKHLLSVHIEEKCIHKEYFSTPKATKENTGTVNMIEESRILVTLKGEEHSLNIKNKALILDALVAAKLDPPYSCTSGACSTCMAKVTSGSVKMDACYALEEDEIDAGYILTCQARATSEEVKLTFDI